LRIHTIRRLRDDREMSEASRALADLRNMVGERRVTRQVGQLGTEINCFWRMGDWFNRLLIRWELRRPF
jgi:hypothetical protein